MRLCTPPPSAWGSPKAVLLGSSQETCLASPSPLPSASSVKQWSSWRCDWSHCHARTLPCYPVSGGRGSRSAAVFHSTCWSSCFPRWNITLQHLQHSCSLRPWHSHHHAWLKAWHTYLCTLHLVAATHAWSRQNKINSSSPHQTMGHGSSNQCALLTCLQQTVWRLSCVSTSEEASTQPCTPILCRVRRMVWALTGWSPTSSISAAMLTGLLRQSFKESIWMWRSARALSFFGRPTRGLFWVDLAGWS